MHNSHSYIVYPNISSSTKPFSSFSDKFFQIYAYKISIFSVLYRYKVRKLVFPDLAPLSTIGLFFFFFLPQYTPYRATVDTDDKPAPVDGMYNDEPGISKLKAPL